MALVGIVTRTITKTSQGANGQTLTTTYQLTGNSEHNILVTTGVETNTEILLVFTAANLQAYYAEWIPAVNTSTCTLKFNSSGSPAPAILLTADDAGEWDVTMFAQNNTAYPNPFQSNVTPGVFITTTGNGTLNLSFLLQN